MNAEIIDPSCMNDRAPDRGSTPRNGAEALLDSLQQQGVQTIFGYPGGTIMPVYDALTESPIQHILTRHEQGAAFAANGMARVTGKAGVCMATSGPGATNLITGIADAHLDSVPLVAITGQVPTPLMGTDAFQEVDIFGMTMPVVKHSFIARDSSSIPSVVRDAFHIAESGRPGPVLVDLPKDAAMGHCHPRLQPLDQPAMDPIQADALDQATRLVQEARRPVFYLGGGVVLADAVDQVRSMAADAGIPIVATLKALGTVPRDNPDFMGMIGMHGSQAANLAVQESDLLICIGARFDDRATGRLDEFAPHARVLHFDRDTAEVSKLRQADVGIVGCLREHVAAFRPEPSRLDTAWVDRCRRRKHEFAPRYDAPGPGIYGPALINQLSRSRRDPMIVSCDVGQHQMWVAQHWNFDHPRHHLTSGALGAMGFGIPAALGAKMACPDATVVCVSGDGSIMMNIQELATLARYSIDVKIVLLDNSALGMVRQWQELFFEKNFSEIDLSDNPDFTSVARAFGIDAFRITEPGQVTQGINRLLDSDGPCLMHVPIDQTANVWPLVPPGANNAQMMEESTP